MTGPAEDGPSLEDIEGVDTMLTLVVVGPAAG